jgi:amiloride-sensitive sodium channel
LLLIYCFKFQFSAQFARLTIFFKDAQFITSKRSELYGTTDFLANCGGLLGLFMGVSILSIVELFYYCTIRPYYIIKKQKKQRKTKPALEINGMNLNFDNVPGKSDKKGKAQD